MTLKLICKTLGGKWRVRKQERENTAYEWARADIYVVLDLTGALRACRGTQEPVCISEKATSDMEWQEGSQITGFNCLWWAAPRATGGLLYLTCPICACAVCVEVCFWVYEKDIETESWREKGNESGIFLLLAFCFNSHPITCPIELTSLCHSLHNTTPGPVSLAAIFSCSPCCLP